MTVRVEVHRNGQATFADAIRLLGEAADYLYGQWLPQNRYWLRDGPVLERYLTEPDASLVAIEYGLPISLHK